MSHPRRVLLQPAYVLHRREYRNTSLLVEILSAEHGRSALIAKGARSPRSRWRPLLQPFVPLLVSWAGRGELATVTEVEPAGRPLHLSGERIYSALYLNELLVRLMQRHDPHPEVFALYGESLQALTASDDPEPPLRSFEVELLAHLGYGLTLERDASSGEAIDADTLYCYQVELGPVPAAAMREPQSGVLVHGRVLMALRGALEWDEPARVQAKKLMRHIIDFHLAGRPIRARELYAVSGRPRSGSIESNTGEADGEQHY